jgi:4a-hydroxytetrahydrobiopterin dehydratase
MARERARTKVGERLQPLSAAVLAAASTMLRAVELLPDSEIEPRLAELEGWEREGETIVKTFELADFVGSVEFIRMMVDPAEEMGHHPDLTVSWNKVGVSITTHAAGGLTANDFELAKRIDALPA